MTTSTSKNELPTIEIDPKWYTILKIGFMFAALAVIAINVLSSVSALPQNTTDWDFAIKYCNCELVDDIDKEEQEELEDEEEHELESEKYEN